MWLSVRDGDGEAVFGGGNAGNGGWSDEEEGEGESLTPQQTVKMVRTMERDGEKKRREGKEEGRRRKATSRDGAHRVQGEGEGEVGAMALLRAARSTSDLKAALLALREMDRRGGREEEGGGGEGGGPRLDFAAVVSLAHDKLEQYQTMNSTKQ